MVALNRSFLVDPVTLEEAQRFSRVGHKPDGALGILSVECFDETGDVADEDRRYLG